MARLAPVKLNLLHSARLGERHAVGVAPEAGDLGLENAAIIRPDAKESSVLWERLRRLDRTRMPPLASGVVDGLAVGLIGEWIDSGPR